jgi:hypothetical protein
MPQWTAGASSGPVEKEKQRHCGNSGDQQRK